MFYLFAGLMAAIAALALLWPFLVGPKAVASRYEHDMEAHRAQLREIDQDLARGLLTQQEAENARVEVSRRLLNAADKAEAEGTRVVQSGARWPFWAVLAAPLAAFGLYAVIGSAGMPDEPLAERIATNAPSLRGFERPTQAQAEADLARENAASVEGDDPNRAEYQSLVDQLSARMQEQPDPTGFKLLGNAQRRLGDPAAAWRSYQQAAALSDEVDADLQADLGETMMVAADGYISPEAEVVFDEVLAQEPAHDRARYYKGMAEAQRGELAEAHARWSALLAEVEPEDAWGPLVYRRTRRAAEMLRIAPPEMPEWARQAGSDTADISDAVAPGPDAEDIAAAAQMPAQDRMAMIEGMVAGLAQKLEEEPDDPQGWVRLLTSYRVLGREEERRAALARARDVFDGNDEALALIESAN